VRADRAELTSQYSFPLDGFQLQAFDALDAGESVLVAAPTGSGKTVVAEYAIEAARRAGRRAFYTAPIKALSNQKYHDLVERYGPDSVGLLTGGDAAITGGETIKRAGELLREAHAAGRLRFHGNVEGNDIFKGTTDIVVCDGFVGNVLLKTAEGLASMMGEFIREEFSRGPGSRLAAIVALPVLRRFKARVDHRRYNGAALLGLRGLVFKSHGSADAYAFEQALGRAYDAAHNHLLQRVQARIAAACALAAAPEAVPAL
jgi:hypothetical protein